MGDPEEAELLSGPGEERERTSPRARRRLSGRGRTVAAATAVAVLALGGTVAYAATSGGTSDGAPGGSPSASWPPDGFRHGHGGPWSGLGGEAVHGEATVKDGDSGEWVVRVWQRGTVERTDGDRITVRSEGGTSWTWTVDGDTHVRADGGSGTGTLKKGDTVYVTGSRTGDGDDAERTADRVLSGTSGDMNHQEHQNKQNHHDNQDHRERHSGSPGHGPWDRDGRSPEPEGSGAAT
ncbi:hypothetical protein [Streptomyces sp. NPDC088766]|uniref:hypothetical protein n=1 Tax=Streptomyces sp. NPDC088766 TaxID=3365893 RepID=UPI00382D5AEC